MTIRTARLSLTVLWVGCFALCLVASLYLRWGVGIGQENFLRALDVISSQYVPYVGVILGLYFGVKHDKKANRQLSLVSYRVAILMSTLWNLVIVGFLIRACLEFSPIEESLGDIGGAMPKLSWLVAPVTGYFFARSHSD